MEGQRKELPKSTLDEQKRICEVRINMTKMKIVVFFINQTLIPWYVV